MSSGTGPYASSPYWDGGEGHDEQQPAPEDWTAVWGSGGGDNDVRSSVLCGCHYRRHYRLRYRLCVRR